MTELKKKLEEMRNGKILNKKQVEFLQKICKKLKNFELEDVDYVSNNEKSCYMTFQMRRNIHKNNFIQLLFTYQYFPNETLLIELISKIYKFSNLKLNSLYTTYIKFETEKELERYFFLIKNNS